MRAEIRKQGGAIWKPFSRMLHAGHAGAAAEVIQIQHHALQCAGLTAGVRGLPF